MRVLYHGNCFDGCVSAALFSLFYRACIRPDEEMEYVGLTHGPRGPLSDALFGDGENVIVDFRYSESDSLTWWFDHHHSAFYSADARSHFEKSRESGQFVFDDKAASCAGLLARAVSERYGFDLTPYKNLIEWAECIDSASFPDAETAVMLPDVPLKLMLFLEANTNEELEKTVIRGLQEHTMQEVFEFEEIQSAFLPIWERHLETIDVIRAQAECDGDTVYFDLTETPLQQYNKFIPYYLFPEAVYAVGLLATEKRVKVGVGSNPWAQDRRTHQIADLCESYGGGGHPAVGAISLAPGDLKQGRQVLGEVVAALKSE